MPCHLYQISDCPECVKVRGALDRLGVEYEAVHVEPGGSDEVRRVSGQDRVPVLVDGTTVVAGSANILRYLVASANGSDLLPDGARDQALAWMMDGYAGGVLGPLVDRVRSEGGIWPPAGRDEGKSGEPGPLGRATAPAGARDELARELQHAEGLLSGRDYLLGDSPTLADLALHAFLSRLAAGDGSPIPDDYPRLRSWYARLRS